VAKRLPAESNATAVDLSRRGELAKVLTTPEGPTFRIELL
jgi:hypothetical protein